MAALSFDDILPEQGPAPAPVKPVSGALSFDDIMPDAAPAPGAPAPAAPAAAPAAAPWYAQAGQAADDLARLAAGGLSFGYSDKLAGYLSGTGTAAERAKTEEARQRSGIPGMIAEYGAPLVPFSAMARSGLTLAQRVPQAISNLGTRTLAAGAEGAGYGALTAAGHDEDIATGAKIGALAGAAAQPIAEVASSAAGGIADLFNKRPAVPVARDLRLAASDAYDAAERSGVIVKPQFVQDLSTRIKSALAKSAYSPNRHTGVTDVLSEIENAVGQNVTLRGVENMRQIASDLRATNDPASARLGRIMVKEIDAAMDGINQTHLLSGNKTEGVRALKEARALTHQSKKAEMVEEAMRRAEDQAASAGTGGNLENAIRQQFKNVLNSRQSRFLSEDEREALRNVVQADTFANAMRHLGRFSPNAGWLQAAANTGAALSSGGLSLAGSAAAMGAKEIAEKAAQNRVYGLARVIANKGAAPPPIQNAVQRLSEAERETLAKVLMSWGIQGGIAGGLGAALP